MIYGDYIHDNGGGKLVHIAGCKLASREYTRSVARRLSLNGVSPHITVSSGNSLRQQMLDMRNPWTLALGFRDQGQLGDCTASTLELLRWIYWKAGLKIPRYSYLAQWAWTREREGTPLTNNEGCTVADAVATLHDIGACPEILWPSDDPEDGTWELAPPDNCQDEAHKNEAMSFHSVEGFDAMREQLANWYPVAFGFQAFQSLMSPEVASSGVVPMPAPNDPSIGGHCVIAVGYCDQRQAVLFANSWGPTWGDKGFGWMPYQYFAEASGLAADMWVVHTAEGVTLPGSGSDNAGL